MNSPLTALEHTEQRKLLYHLAIFIFLVNGFAWLATLLGGTPDTPGPGLWVWGLAPLGSAVIMCVVTKEWQALGLRPAWLENRRWYLLSFLLYPIALPLIVGLGVLTGVTSVEAFSWSAYGQALPSASIIYLIFAIFEEFGWRGYLAYKVAQLSINQLLGHGIVGLVWAAWHFPFIAIFAAPTSEALAGFVPRYILGILAFAIVYGEIKRRTQSVWPAVLLHWVGNTLATPLLMLVSFKQGSAWLGSFGASGLGMIVGFGALGLVLYWRRERFEKHQGDTSLVSSYGKAMSMKA